MLCNAFDVEELSCTFYVKRLATAHVSGMRVIECCVLWTLYRLSVECIALMYAFMFPNWVYRHAFWCAIVVKDTRDDKRRLSSYIKLKKRLLMNIYLFIHECISTSDCQALIPAVPSPKQTAQTTRSGRFLVSIPVTCSAGIFSPSFSFRFTLWCINRKLGKLACCVGTRTKYKS